jgi:hypothetical protein
VAKNKKNKKNKELLVLSLSPLLIVEWAHTLPS